LGVVHTPRGDLRFTGRRESVKVQVMVKRAHGSGFWILWSLWMFWLRAWPGQRYRLEASDDLRSAFQGVEEIEAPPDGEFAEVRINTGGDRRYFRIR
jgi:hypothetical protein